MENLAPSSALSPVLRPVFALQGDTAALMREGRVLAGEVLERLDGGTYVLSFAGQRVAAESRVELEVGSTRNFEVVRRAGELVLRPVEQATTSSESPLLRALHGLAGADLSPQAPLDALESLLQLAKASGGDARARLAALLDALARRVLDPASGADGLRALLERAGSGSATALLAALVEGGMDAPGSALHAFATALAAALDRALLRAGVQETQRESASLVGLLEEALEHALQRLSPVEIQSLQREQVQSLAAALQRELVRTLREPGSGSRGAQLALLLEAEGESLLLEGGSQALLRLVFQDRSAPWARALREIAMRAHASDLEGLLLDASSELPAGEQRDTALRALRSLDLERVVQHARQQSGEPVHRWFLVPDAQARARVDLLLEHRRGETGADPERDGSWRLVLGVDFQALGPVRADLLVRRRDIVLRLTAERSSTVARLSSALQALEQDLASLGRRLEVHVVQAADGEASLEQEVSRIRFLREHNLMDVRA
jgi:hypothetical protein